MLLITVYNFVASLRILSLPVLNLTDVLLLLLSQRIFVVPLFVIDDVLPFWPLTFGGLLSLLPLFSLCALCLFRTTLTLFGLEPLRLRYNLFALFKRRQSLVPLLFFLLLLVVLLLSHPLNFSQILEVRRLTANNRDRDVVLRSRYK